MKKLFQDVDKRFIISLIIIITLLSATAFAYAVNTILPEMDSKGSSGTALDTINFESQYLTLADLLDKYDILCCYHGGNDAHLPGSNSVKLTAGDSSTTETESGKKIGELTTADVGKEIALKISNSTSSSTPYTEKSYKAETWAWFEVVEKVVTSPDNSYILAEMITEVDPDERFQIFYDDNYSTVQHAWWVTDDNHGTNHNTSNALYEEAEAFNTYIEQVAVSTNVDDFVDTYYEIEVNGETHSGTVPAPVLKYEPQFTMDPEKVTVTFDVNKNTYTIGPFSIDYVEESFEKVDPQVDQDKRDPIQFAGIINAQLYTNLGEVPFAITADETGIANPIQNIPGAKWRFNFLKDEREASDDYRFPHANETFYVELDYIPGATRIENLHFDFKYMNAGGQYEKLEGKYYEQTWKPKSSVAEYCQGKCGHSSHDANSTCDGKCSHGQSTKHAIKWNYWLALTSMDEKTAQLLAYGVVAARWYDYRSLDLGNGPDFKEWDYQIIKKVVDENGNEISSSVTDKFDFEVIKDGILFDKVKVSPKAPYISSTYKIGSNEEYPSIDVNEALSPEMADKYEFVSKEVQVQESGAKKTFIFSFINKIRVKHGEVSLTKHADEAHKDWEFQFKLYINNKLFVNENTTSDGIITIHPGETWKSGKIAYTGDARYRVEEVNIPDGARLYKITNKEGKLSDGKTARIDAYNDERWDRARISIKKVLDGNITSNETFTVKLRVGEKIYVKELKAGQTWSDEYIWERGTTPPDYEVQEIDLPEGWTLVSINNKSGVLSPNTEISVVITNDATEKHGNFSITKEVVTDDKIQLDNNLEFTFEARVSGTFEYEGESIVNGTKVIRQTLKANETWTSPEFTWKGDTPTYKVEEVNLPEGWKFLRMSNASGMLNEGKTIEVVCVNEYEVRIAFDLTMEMAGVVWADKPLNEEDKNTEDSVANGRYDEAQEEGIENIEVYIWKVLYSNGTEVRRVLATGYEEGTETELTFPLYTSADGKWKAPKMSVPGLTDEEKAEGITKATYDVEFYYDGQTYEPTKYLANSESNVENYRNRNTSANQEEIDRIKEYVRNTSFETMDNLDKAKAFRNKPSEVNAGVNLWRATFDHLSMAVESQEDRDAFNNRFATITGDTPIEDDGSTTGYSVAPDGTRTDLLYYSVDSMPSLDGNTRKLSELQTLNDGFVKPEFKMAARTSTDGLTWPFDNKYHLLNIDKQLNKIESGIIITYHYSATYPYLLNINLGLVRRDEAELSVTKDVYSANVVVNQKLMNYKYNEYIDFENEKYQDYLNLQLKVADANISYKLDLYESDYYYRAKVYEGNTVQGALEEFYRSIGKNNLSDELDLDVFLTYKISVYNNSDSYLAEVKKLTDYFDEDLELVDTKVSRYIQEANGVSVDSETVVASPAYVIKKGPTEDSMWAEQLNQSIEGRISVSDALINSSIEKISNPNSNEGMEVSGNVRAEEGKKYYKAEIDLADEALRLAVGEKLELYLTFKVKTDEAPASFGNEEGLADAVKSYVRLGTKSNVAEIAAYSTYYADSKKIAGKVDKDSAPNNTDIVNKNDKAWYEDDCDSAPIITLDLYTETRNVTGMAWEDKETEEIDYNQKIGNGIYDEGERLIGNLTTQMVEKIRVKVPGAEETYKEYDFVWPTDQSFDFLNGQTLEQITGFDSITLTSNRSEDTGMYNFKNIPAGNYVVRFTYGNFPADSLDENGNLIKLEGANEPQTSDDNSRKPAVYNGQDFKTTKYQADVVNEDGTSKNISNGQGYIDNEWYDFASCKYDEDGKVISHNSDAIDNEARRLEVIAYSRILDHDITSVLATANNYTADHTELYKQTNMFADTAKINLNIENMNSLSGQKIVITDANTGAQREVIAGGEETQNGLKSNYVFGKTDVNGGKGTVSLLNYAYVVEAVDIGIEERSNTEIVLDKEIESITLTPNTGTQPILKAVYDIGYEYTLDRNTGKSAYKAKVELNRDKSYGTEQLLAQNKDEEAGIQNFRYIYYDDAIAQSLNLEVKYRFTALNVGEVDRANEFVENSTPEELLAKAQEIKDQTYVKVNGKLVSVKHPKVGEFIGSIYYIGKNATYNQSDIVVTTTMRQLIDYVDNDAVFKASDNNELNTSWRSVTPDELLENKVIDSNIIGDYDGMKNIIDDRGIVYSTNERSNLILSVDSVSGEKLANPGFIVKLVPFSASKQNNALDTTCETAMNLTMTRSIDSEISDDDLSYDNIAEIVKFENTVGKRDIETIAGNADPKLGEFKVSLEERDSSATELITFTPPTGLDVKTSLTIQMLMVSVVALLILAIGVVVIKKVVLK